MVPPIRHDAVRAAPRGARSEQHIEGGERDKDNARLFVSAWLLFAAALLPAACAAPHRSVAADAQFARLTQVVRLIRAEYIVPLDDADLARAASAGLYRAGGSGGAGEEARGANPWADFVRSYLAALESDPAADSKKLIDGAIAGVIGRLDRLSRYLDAAELRAMRDAPTQGAVGVTLQRIDGRILIIGTVQGSAGEALELMRGDRLLQIEGEPIDGLLLQAIARRLRGAPGSLVRLTIERKGERYGVLARRSVLTYSGVDSALYPGQVAYIKIQRFGASTAVELAKHLAGIKLATAAKIRGVVLDLRSNGGGVLSGVVGVADLFLEDGLILYTDGRGRDSRLKFSAAPQMHDLSADIPVIVLVDGQTGSGAEMLASLLQDRKRARVIGTTTFGLNSIQSLFPLRDGAALKLTTARFYTPSGRALGDAGVVPDVCSVDAGVVFLDRERIENTGGAREACPGGTHIYEKESDDIELRAALDALRTHKETLRERRWTHTALNEYTDQ